MISSAAAALQHRPRPLPLFLALLRSETATSPSRMLAALEGLRRYQMAERPPRPTAPPVIARAGRASLLDYGGDGPSVVFVPSLINPPHVLDLSEDRSLLRWLARQGVRPLLVDWGVPGPQDHKLDIGGHVEQLLLPLLASLPMAPILAGYCLGGTMAVAAASRVACQRLVLIATPWDFGGFPEADRTHLVDLWTAAEPGCNVLGLMPMEILQSSFWQIDPARTIMKFEEFSRLDPASEAAATFVTLEDWANDGPPLTYAAARELFDDMFDANTPGRGRWRVGDQCVRLGSVGCRVLNIVSTTDRIVPAASAPAIGERLTLERGHVGMIVGRHAQEELWKPLARWLSAADLS